MQDSRSAGDEFLDRITGIIHENISDEGFGVSELAAKIGMSRSNLLRKIKKYSRLSVNQFIRQVRLKKAMDLLRQISLNVSEVSYEVGFGSSSYFIKCFREFYGYPPGEVGKRDSGGEGTVSGELPRRNRVKLLAVSTAAIIVAAIILLVIIRPFNRDRDGLEKSIAVLPFINDSDDPANVYLVNGLMESILNNLQNIEDLRVISRTSVEKYRNHPGTIAELSKELNVNYFVEGSGQKIGDEILLNIQLIEAPADEHLWTAQFRRKARDIFELQAEVAKKIADRIQATITPEEAERISKPPTDNLAAYDFFLKGLDLMNLGDQENLMAAVEQFGKAVKLDPEFARAYADLAIAYYLMDRYHNEKQYYGQIHQNADRAVLLDPKLPQGLIAQAFVHMNDEEYEKAVPYLEKALEYNPNSALVINILSDFYANYLPDTEKYLEYALRGIRLDIAANDSITAGIIYLHLSNAFIQTGFTVQAEKYINRSLDYWPGNLYSEYVKAYFLYAGNGDLQKTKDLLIKALDKDTTRLDILQEAGKICYYMRDYPSAYRYYKKFSEEREAQHLDIFPYEDAKIGLVYAELGLEDEAERLFADYKEYAVNDRSVYRDLSLAMYYSYEGETEQALKHLEEFAEQSDFHYWVLLFLKQDPLADNIRDLPEFNRLFSLMEVNFWRHHMEIRETLRKKSLI